MRGIDTWNATVNGVAMWRLWTESSRARLLRRFGLDVGTGARVHPCFIGSDKVLLGPHSYVGPGSFLDGSAAVTLGERAGLGYEVMIITGSHEMGSSDKRYGPHANQPVHIGAGAWVGARTTILPGVTVGDGTVIGAGSLVTADCAPNSVYLGSPARCVRALD